MSNINFDNPYLLLIAVPLVVLFVVPFAIAVRKDNRNGHNITSMVLHILMAAIIGLAAAGTTITTVLTETQVYVVADVSYSANKNLTTIDNIIKNELKLPRNSKVGIVTFGKDYELLCEMGDQKNVKSVKESTVDDSETNIAEALEYAGTLFDDDVIKRIVLITDGRQTDEEDTTAMRRAVDLLDQQNVKVDAYFLDDNLRSDTPEVQISGAEYTKSAFINHKEYVRVTVQSNCETSGMITLIREGAKPLTRALPVYEGQNIATFELYTDEGGTYDYEVRIEMEKDASEYNNTYSFTQTVATELKVLMVTNDWEDCGILLEQYGESAKIDLFENSDKDPIAKLSLYGQYANNEDINVYCFNRSVNAIGDIVVKDVPNTVEALSQYDMIVLADVDFNLMPAYRDNFIKNLDTVVKKFGKSLITIGEITEITEITTKELPTVSKMLPVRIGNSGGALYTLVIDASLSMYYNNNMRLAKNIATTLVQNMQDSDSICIVYFDGDTYVLTDPVQVTNKSDLISKIMALDVRQNTRIDAGLNRAYGIIKDLNIYSDKQLMLITDGLQTVDLTTLVGNMYRDEIVTSIVHLDTGNSSTTLKTLAENVGHGKYYRFNAMLDDHDEIEFGEMASTMIETYYEGDPRSVETVKPDDVLNGINEGLPDVSGYMIGYTKASANTILQVKHVKDSGKEISVPLYAYWNYEKGKVASFTSKISGDWMSAWKNSDISEIFFDNVLNTNIPDEKSDYPFTLNVTKDGSFTEVQVVPEDSNVLIMSATMKLTLPDGTTSDRILTWQDNKLLYSDTFKSAEVGRYEMEITFTRNGVSYTTVAVVNTSFSSEYDEFVTFEASPLFRAVNGRGQVILEGQLVLENDENEVGVYTNDFTLPLLIIAVVLFVVDIIVRKLKWEDIKSFFGGFKKQEGKKQ